jgi:CxxC motif-containing protein (DUF1111 family)
LYCTVAQSQAPYSGGSTTIFNTSVKAYSLPAKNLSYLKRQEFFIGKSFFRNSWLIAPSSTRARDGLGPLFNTNTCHSCHVNDGRGLPYVGDKPMNPMLVRLSVNSDSGGEDDPHLTRHGFISEPSYGSQIQNRAIPGVPAEANVKLKWSEEKFDFPDGTSVLLRKPQIILSKLAYGELHENVALSARIAPAMIGLGLLEAIPESTLREIADNQNRKDNGVSGKLNMVWDQRLQKTVPGRFGWKAAMPSVEQQVASAFLSDLGITSRMFPETVCTKKQAKCLSAPSGGNPELADEFLDFITSYSKTLAVPARRNIWDKHVVLGEQYFRDAGCNQCHVETIKTGTDKNFPELSLQEIHPYTDLLLHDMGEGLADYARKFLAAGVEWRTPPLWGIGLLKTVNGHTDLLHDGRARNIEEAILWHQGEAEASRDHYVDMPVEQRQQLVKFINSL